MLADTLRWMLTRRFARDPGTAPEILEVERRAAVAMTSCTCGHMWHLHEHPHVRTGCDGCRCERFRPAEPPPPMALHAGAHPVDEVVIRLRVAWLTQAWRDRRAARPRG